METDEGTQGNDWNVVEKKVLEWFQKQGWQRIDSLQADQCLRIEERDLQSIHQFLPSLDLSCRWAVLRVNGEHGTHHIYADILVCTQHNDEIIQLPTQGYRLLRCSNCQRVIFGHQQRYLSRSLLSFDITAPPPYTVERFCTPLCCKTYVTYLEDHADELFPSV